MSINIMLFGQLTDITGAHQLSIPGVTDTDSLVKKLQADFPGLAGSTYLIAVDKQVISTNTPLHDHSTVALLPPFSGG